MRIEAGRMGVGIKNRLIDNLGTIVPAVIAAGFLWIFVQDWKGGEIPGWERSGVYLFVGATTVMALQACYRIAKESGGTREAAWGWSVFLYSVAIRELSLLPLYTVLFASSLGVGLPDWLIFALLIAASLGMGIANVILWAGTRYGFLEMRIDVVPLRSVIRKKR